MKVSVVMSMIDGREELLERSLWCYTKQTLKPEVIVVADRPKSRDAEELVSSYQDRLNAKYFELSGPSGWRNGYGQNKGIYESTGDIVVATHPEAMMEPIGAAEVDGIVLSWKRLPSTITVMLLYM